MRRLPLFLIVLGPIAAVAAGVLIVRARTARETQPIAAGALRGADVLLVTIDTLRADHVGAYGRDGALTPTIDGLAKDGLRFERTYSHVPLTLPSHATILTGAYPTRTGVRDNGAFRLGDRTATLAAALGRAGYRTGAFVGAFVLDARFGLNRGFDVYDDRMLGTGADQEISERPAEKVLAPAADWILARRQQPADSQPPEKPWFAWVHLYDPHAPYAPPEPYRSQYADEPYDGEIAYADAALGAFLARLRSAGALTRTLIVIASDHGESLGEHGERTHGLFAYDATIRVPLVLYAPEAIRAGVFRQPTRLVDVAPTILDLVGAAPLDEIDGRSVRPYVAGERSFDDPGSYFEAMNANLTRDWAPLTGIVRGGVKLVDLPIPELYDLAADPTETRNIYTRETARAHDLESALDRVAGAAAPSSGPSAVDPDAQARLRALGYVVASSARPPRTYTAADDPKRLVHLDTALDDASAMWGRGDAAHAIETLQQVLRERPTMTIAYDRLAYILRASGRVREAVTLLDEAAKSGRADPALLEMLGEMLRDAGDLPRSAAVLEPIVKSDPANLRAADALGQTYARMGRGIDAARMFTQVLDVSPNAATTWNNLGSTYLSQGKNEEAANALSRAIALNPELAAAHNGLGVVYARQGSMDRAVAEWQRAVALRPGYRDALDNLARARR